MSHTSVSVVARSGEKGGLLVQSNALQNNLSTALVVLVAGVTSSLYTTEHPVSAFAAVLAPSWHCRSLEPAYYHLPHWAATTTTHTAAPPTLPPHRLPRAAPLTLVRTTRPAALRAEQRAPRWPRTCPLRALHDTSPRLPPAAATTLQARRSPRLPPGHEEPCSLTTNGAPAMPQTNGGIHGILGERF